MNSIANKVAELRILVGYLGEKSQQNWWGCDFLHPTAISFLAPIFNRSLFLAQYQGLTTAASLVHDEVIGEGGINHLFRLPISLEQACSQEVQSKEFYDYIKSKVGSYESAFARLGELSCIQSSVEAGPLYITNVDKDLTQIIPKIAGIYYFAFSDCKKIYPYIRDVL